jgi:hypothetical protein
LSGWREKREGFEMGNVKKIFVIVFPVLIIFFLLLNAAEAKARVYYGKVIAIEGNMLQVKADNGRVSVFWIGHRTQLDSRLPFFGDRVRIEYVKDKLKRNAVTRLTILGRK